jgi:hypothetical protein
MTTITHNNIEYSINSFTSEIEITWDHESDPSDYNIETIKWDNICPDDNEFNNEVDYIKDNAQYYLGNLPVEVYTEALRIGFGSKIADTLHALA